MGQELISPKGFLSFFRDHPPTFAKAHDSTTMRVGGRRYAYDDLDSIEKLIGADTVLKYGLVDWYELPASEKIEWFSNFVEGTFREDMMHAKRARAELSKKIRSNGKAELQLPNADEILTHLQPIRVLGDVRKEAGFRFLDTQTGILTDYDYHALYYALRSAGLQREAIEEYMTRVLHCREDYDPKNHYKFRKVAESNNIYEINRYVPPAWLAVDDVTPELPEEIAMLLNHLLPSEDCREFVLTWIYHSLTSRAGTYLYLCGGQATGKNTLAAVIAALHGIHNTSNPKQDSFTGRFNHFLKFKRFVFFDEFNCRKRQDKDILKSIINDRVQIEAKGKDHEDIDIHASYLVANNSLEAIGLDPIDRRFSVPDITHEPIVPVYGRPWIQNFATLLRDKEYVARFGRYVLQEYENPKWANEDPYQKSRFEEIVLATARFAHTEMLAKVLAGEQDEYEYYTERESFCRVHKGQKYPAIQDWLKFWRDVQKDGLPLGKIEGYTFYPRSEFRVSTRRGADDLD